MKFRVLFNPEIYEDLKEAMDWYEEKQAGLGIKFLATAKIKINSLRNSALQYSV